MITVSEPIEQPLLAALYRRSPRPMLRDAMECLKDEEVQNLAVSVAERARKLAMEEDDQRLLVKKSLINYRRFYVGGVGIGLTLSQFPGQRPYEWFVFAAFNTKPSKKASKYCAEMRIMKACRDVRCSCVGGFVVVGERQPDGRSGVQGMTLDPCEACRDQMRCDKYRSMIRRTTLLLTAQPQSQIRNLKTIPDLMRIHGEEW